METNHRNKVGKILLIIATIALIAYLGWRVQYERSQRIESTNLIESLNDTVQVWKDKDGKNHAKISVLETSRIKDFLDIQSRDKTIQDLQGRVKEYKDKLVDGSSVTIIKGQTKYDTVYKTKESIKEVLGDANILDSINNRWITSVFGFKGDSTIYSLNVRNEYSLIIGEEKQGWFKPRKPFAEVIDENPYTTTDTLRTYRINDTRPKFNFKSAVIGGVSVATILGLLAIFLSIN